MYWDDMRKCFAEVKTAEEEGMDKLLMLAERCREQLCDRLGEEGIVILEQYIACLDILNKKCDF